jgi:hypothetical protein
MSEQAPNEEGRKEQLAGLSERIEAGKKKIMEDRETGNAAAEELHQISLNILKRQRFELLDEKGREDLFVEGIDEFESSYEELVEMGMPIDLGVIKLDVYGDSDVEISEEMEARMLEHLAGHPWWEESEHYDE